MKDVTRLSNPIFSKFILYSFKRLVESHE